jgi:hypothetical protein
VADSANIVPRIPINLAGKSYLTKDDIAILDIIASNFYDRPIYFAVTTRVDKMMGLEKYCQLEGMALRIIPVQSPGDSQFGSMLGAGRVAADKVLDNVMNKFRWGNFDKKEMFVDNSYGPSVQSQQFIMIRTAEFLNQNNRNEEALELADKYFEVFPNFNFPYDYQTAYMLDVYIRNSAGDKAGPIMDQMAENILDELEFYASVNPSILQSSYAREKNLATNAATTLLTFAQQLDDQERLSSYQAMFAAYLSTTNQQQQPLRD